MYFICINAYVVQIKDKTFSEMSVVNSLFGVDIFAIVFSLESQSKYVSGELIDQLKSKAKEYLKSRSQNDINSFLKDFEEILCREELESLESNMLLEDIDNHEKIILKWLYIALNERNSNLNSPENAQPRESEAAKEEENKDINLTSGQTQNTNTQYSSPDSKDNYEVIKSVLNLICERLLKMKNQDLLPRKVKKLKNTIKNEITNLRKSK